MSKDQVEALLGPPDDETLRANATGQRMLGAERRSYFLDHSYFHGYDDAFLYTHFDESGKLLAGEVYGY